MGPKKDYQAEWLGRTIEAIVADAFSTYTTAVAGFYFGLVAEGIPIEVSIRLTGEWMQAMLAAARAAQMAAESEKEV